MDIYESATYERSHSSRILILISISPVQLLSNDFAQKLANNFHKKAHERLVPIFCKIKNWIALNIILLHSKKESYPFRSLEVAFVVHSDGRFRVASEPSLESAIRNMVKGNGGRGWIMNSLDKTNKLISIRVIRSFAIITFRLRLRS